MAPSSAIGDFIIGESAIGGTGLPPGSPGLLHTIPSYLYKEYEDDEDLQAFVRSYNALAQGYLDWFNEVGLPIYTGPMIVGALLDWVAAGLYGFTRPVLPSGRNQNLGPYNTYTFNAIPFNTQKVIGPANYFATSDDVFKRIITWHFYKGDGKAFTIEWLKRRVMRFLVGTNGTAPQIDQTYQISVTFGAGDQVNINILSGARVVTGGALFNRSPFNSTPLNTLYSVFVPYAPLLDAPIFKAAVDAGVLELPFQFTWVVNI